MTTPADAARDDLAYLRALVEPNDDFQRRFGETYFVAGLCYGVQMLLHALQYALSWTNSALGLAIGLGPTVVFLALLVWLIRRRPTDTGGSTVSRAVGAVFGAVGVANLALLFVVGSVALREKSLTIWLLYPCIVLIFQGAAWMVLYALRRRPWFALVSVGWFATAIAMSICIDMPAGFIGAGGVGFIAFMLIPGWLMMRQAKPA